MRLAGGEAQLPCRGPPCSIRPPGRACQHPTHPTTPRMWNEQFLGTARRLKVTDVCGMWGRVCGRGPGGRGAVWGATSLSLASPGRTRCSGRPAPRSSQPSAQFRHQNWDSRAWGPPAPQDPSASPKPTTARVHQAPLCLGQWGTPGVEPQGWPTRSARQTPQILAFRGPDGKVTQVTLCFLVALQTVSPRQRHWLCWDRAGAGAGPTRQQVARFMGPVWLCRALVS